MMLPPIAASINVFDANVTQGKITTRVVGKKDIKTRIVTEDSYQKLLRVQKQNKALRDTSALARASLKQVPDRSG